MGDYFEFTLKEIIYAFVKIINAVDSQNLAEIKSIASQEIKAINSDLENLENMKGDKK